MFSSLVFGFSIIPVIVYVFCFLSVILDSLNLFGDRSSNSLSPRTFPSVPLSTPSSSVILSPTFTSFPSVFLNAPVTTASFEFVGKLPFSSLNLKQPSNAFSLIAVTAYPYSALSATVALENPSLSL